MANVAAVIVYLGLLSLGVCLVTGSNGSQKNDPGKLRGPTETKKRNFFDLKLQDIEGHTKRFEDFRGQVLLVVNVATDCGFTDGHYKGLVRLQQIYRPTGKFTVLAIPCNDFGAQEPGSEKEIHEFATTKYHINFPLFAKVTITGQPQCPVYKFIAEYTGTVPNWNFYKFLVSHEGEVVDFWGPWIDIDSITATVRRAVNAAVMADPGKPNQRASGPPQHEHKDYGDGAGRGGEVWSEGREREGEPNRAGASDLVHDDL